MTDGNVHPFYAERRDSIVEDIDERLRLISGTLSELVPGFDQDELRERVIQELDRMLPLLPYVGGANGRMTPFFEQGAGVIALGRVLRAQAAPAGAVASLMREMFVARLRALPKQERLALGQQFLSASNQELLKAAALRSLDRENPGDFVYDFIAPAGGETEAQFEFGIDYRECGFCKLCEASGDVDLLPNLCAVDDEFYALRGIALKRTTTIAGGAERCNFRFRAIDDRSSQERSRKG